MRPGAAVRALAYSYHSAALLHAAVELHIPDLVAGGPVSAEDMAKAAGADASALHRLLRGLVLIDLVDPVDDRRFGPTPLSDSLRADAPNSEVGTVRILAGEYYQAWAGLAEAVRTGTPAFDRIFGSSFYDHLQSSPEAARDFAAVIRAGGVYAGSIADSYDFGNSSIVDVGGGVGSTLAAILKRYPDATGTLVERGVAAKMAAQRFRAEGVADRGLALEGDFFKKVPAGADVYMLLNVLHDWNDDRASTIAKVCRTAMTSKSRLLVIQRLMPEQIDRSPESESLVMADLQMLVVKGGHERSESEYRSLLGAAGLQVIRVIHIPGGFSILEAAATRRRSSPRSASREPNRHPLILGDVTNRQAKSDVAVSFKKAPTNAAELAAFEARYRPVDSIERWRGLHVDEPRWSRYASALASRWRSADASAVADAQERLLRVTALDSGVLDGLMPANPELTTSVLSSSIGPREAMADMTESMRLVVECHHRAMILAQEAATDGRPIDLNLIGVLYDVITESQATSVVVTETGEKVEVELPRRQFKPVTNFAHRRNGELGVFAPAAQVADEMRRFVAELASATFSGCHPAIQAAYILHAIGYIHPFADGNGRLSRTLASIYMLRAVGVPMLVFADQWASFSQALNASDLGDRQALVNRAASFAMSTMDLAANLVTPRASRVLQEAQVPGLRGRRKESAGAVDEAARGLFDVLWVELREALISAPAGMRIAIVETLAPPDDHTERAYRIVSDSRSGRVGARVGVRLDGMLAAAADLEFLALASGQADDLFPLALREAHSGELLEVAMDDAYPLPLEVTAVRVRMWVERLLAQALTSVLAKGPTDRRGKRRKST